MKQETQLERYKKLIHYIDINFKQEINIKEVESVCNYSYRNINRIFESLHNETIGKYIKRVRLEKAAQYLKYSTMPISEIAYEVGFEDRSAFSKAFKSRFECSPLVFRDSNEIVREKLHQSLELIENPNRQPLIFEIQKLPSFEYLSIEYRGLFDDSTAIKSMWGQLFEYAASQGLLSESPSVFTEIQDDNEISSNLNYRYNLGLMIVPTHSFKPGGLFKVKSHPLRKYAKFIHQGPHEDALNTFKRIYAHWMLDVKLELEDLPILEFYLDDSDTTAPEDLMTEIFIPIK